MYLRRSIGEKKNNCNWLGHAMSVRESPKNRNAMCIKTWISRHQCYFIIINKRFSYRCQDFFFKLFCSFSYTTACHFTGDRIFFFLIGNFEQFFFSLFATIYIVSPQTIKRIKLYLWFVLHICNFTMWISINLKWFSKNLSSSRYTCC